MASSSSSSRMLQPGNHTVNIGPSLGRALKARKLKGSSAPTTTKRSNLPERDFYAFKCMLEFLASGELLTEYLVKFRSQSVDRTKPATVEVKPGTDQVVVEFQSTVVSRCHSQFCWSSTQTSFSLTRYINLPEMNSRRRMLTVF
jgi:hypothetical protein